MSEWKKFTGSEEQISEILNSRNGVKIYFEDDTEAFFEHCLGVNISTLRVSKYMIAQPRPHADMIIEWARTGREVYWYNGCGQWVIDDNPVWWPDMKYSFNPDG